jgi:hypothetical protein
MSRPLTALLLTLSLLAAPARAQHGGGAAPRTASGAPAAATQFDFLVGQWEVTLTPKATTLATRIHGVPKLSGIWKAWRAMDGFGVEDELRIVDGSGNPNAYLRTTRLYDGTQRLWTQMSLDVYRARFTPATAEWVNGEMRIRSLGRDAEGVAYVQRVRFFEITPTSFKTQTDRSTDGEQTWDTAIVRMDARRVAATAPR